MKRFLPLLLLIATTTVVAGNATTASAAGHCSIALILQSSPQGGWFGDCFGYPANERFQIELQCQGQPGTAPQTVWGPVIVQGPMNDGTSRMWRSYAYCTEGRSAQSAIGHYSFV